MCGAVGGAGDMRHAAGCVPLVCNAQSCSPQLSAAHMGRSPLAWQSLQAGWRGYGASGFSRPSWLRHTRPTTNPAWPCRCDTRPRTTYAPTQNLRPDTEDSPLTPSSQRAATCGQAAAARGACSAPLPPMRPSLARRPPPVSDPRETERSPGCTMELSARPRCGRTLLPLAVRPGPACPVALGARSHAESNAPSHAPQATVTRRKPMLRAPTRAGLAC